MGWGIPEEGWRKGPWTHGEDRLLSEYVKLHGEGRWSSVARCTGLNRSGKSCRLRWVNYLRPGLRKGQFTPLEEGIIIEMHALWGNKWSTIARYLPGRTDNEIKNYWRTHFKKKDKSHKKQERGKSPILEQNPPPESQEQQPQEDGMERPTSSAETSCEQMFEAQGREENFSMYPTMEDQCFPMVCQDVASWLDTIKEDDLYSGLWNFDDVGGDMGHLPTGFSYGVDPNSFDDGGYIFVESL